MENIINTTWRNRTHVEMRETFEDPNFVYKTENVQILKLKYVRDRIELLV